MIELNSFTVSSLPRLLFGEGRIAELPRLIAEFGRQALFVTGGRSLRESARWPELEKSLSQASIHSEYVSIVGEPSPEMVDDAVRSFHGTGIDVVVGIGGGSVLDAAKAIAGLLPHGNSVLDHLEDVGRSIPYCGPSTPLIAVPTTAGTGSEATKNAVLSRRGAGGFKKSFRHDTLMARIALVDPALLASCPSHLMASQGLDAFTQLLESYVSLRAHAFTDALALSGLEAAAGGLADAVEGSELEAARRGRSAMAYAALLSGITLAQVGLGSVHGLAQPLGSLFPVPHGVACGSVLAAATEMNVKTLEARMPDSPALIKYARIGRLLSDRAVSSDAEARRALIAVLHAWRVQFALPPLARYGVGAGDIPAIVAAARNNSMKTNPVALDDDEIAAIVRRCL